MRDPLYDQNPYPSSLCDLCATIDENFVFLRGFFREELESWLAGRLALPICVSVVNPPLSIGGKVGEWVQGVDKTGAPVIYSLTVTRSPFRVGVFVERSDALSVLIDRGPLEDHSKTRRAILEFADAYGFAHDCKYRIVICGSPPRGKGLGSSSIDMALALLGLRKERALNASKTDLYKIMCKVERSDYLFDPQFIVAANPFEGTHTVVMRAPDCSVLAWDTQPEKSVKTEAVIHLDRSRKLYEREYCDLFKMIATGDISLILRAATRSAELNNRLLPKVGFETARKLVKELRDIGLVSAHTGTWLGFVLPHPIDEDAFLRISEFFARFVKRKPTRFETGITNQVLRDQDDHQDEGVTLKGNGTNSV